jgi:hypothetical protein
VPVSNPLPVIYLPRINLLTQVLTGGSAASLTAFNEQKRTIFDGGQRDVAVLLLAYANNVLAHFEQRPPAGKVGGVPAERRPLVHTFRAGGRSLVTAMMRPTQVRPRLGQL